MAADWRGGCPAAASDAVGWEEEDGRRGEDKQGWKEEWRGRTEGAVAPWWVKEKARKGGDFDCSLPFWFGFWMDGATAQQSSLKRKRKTAIATTVSRSRRVKHCARGTEGV
jgi:hypothetical protein